MGTFAPFMPDSLEGFLRDFLSFYVNQGVEDQCDIPAGIKGKKVRKGLYSLYSLFSCRVGGMTTTVLSVIGVQAGTKGTGASSPMWVKAARFFSSHELNPRGV